MRVSTLPCDPGEAAYERIRADGNYVRVTFRGEVIDDVVTADEELSLVLRYARDAAGRPIVVDGHLVPRFENGPVSVEIVPGGK